jgi:hypothetical protein
LKLVDQLKDSAFNASVTAWQLCDWVFNDLPIEQRRKLSLKESGHLTATLVTTPVAAGAATPEIFAVNWNAIPMGHHVFPFRWSKWETQYRSALRRWRSLACKS